MGTPYPVIPSAVEGSCVSVRLHGTRNSRLSLNSAALLVALCGSIVVSQRRSFRAKAREPVRTRCDRTEPCHFHLFPYTITFPSTAAATYFPLSTSRNCTTRCPSRASFPHRLGFSGFCSIASYFRPFF